MRENHRTEKQGQDKADELATQADAGARNLKQLPQAILWYMPAWALFQLWIASCLLN